MQNLLEELIQLLSEDERLVSDGKLLKNKVIELALNMDAGLIQLLLKNESIKRHFFVEIGGVLVFDKIKFQKFVSNKQFLPDSYTAFKNKIGLVNENGDYLSESRKSSLPGRIKTVCLKAGRQRKTRSGMRYSGTKPLRRMRLTACLHRRCLRTLSSMTKTANMAYQETKSPLIDFSKVNLIIKGNNLLALHSLYKRFAGKVKLIYIDPPFNTR